MDVDDDEQGCDKDEGVGNNSEGGVIVGSGLLLLNRI